MRPIIIHLTELAYALSHILGIDSDLDVKHATNILNLVKQVSKHGGKSIQVPPKVFVEDWNLSRTIFFGPAPVVPLEESLYKPWTTCEGHPLKGATGLVWGDPAIHMQETLSSFGIDFDPTLSSSPDHLAVILEFVGFLLETERFDVVSPFSKDHLDWLELVLNHMDDCQMGRGAREPIEAAIALREVIISLN